MGCLPKLSFSHWRTKKTTTTPLETPAPRPAENVDTDEKSKRRSLPHHIGILPFERKKRDTKEIAKRESGKSTYSDVTFVDEEENAKRASRLSTGRIKLDVDLKDKDELVDGLRYRGSSVRRRDTIDTLETPITPTTTVSAETPLTPVSPVSTISEASAEPDSPEEEERTAKWKEEGVEDPEAEKRRQQTEAEKKKAMKEEQDRLDFFQMM